MKHRKETALIVVDLQSDFYDPRDGALYVPDAEAIILPIIDRMRYYETVVATQDWHPATHVGFASSHNVEPFTAIQLYGEEQTLWPDHCMQDTSGAELQHDVAVRADLILRKGTNPNVDSYSAFRENVGPDRKRAPTGLMGWLFARGIREVHICGLARDYCVKYTALDAAYGQALSTTVLWSLTRAVNPASDQRVADELRIAGVGIGCPGGA